MQTSPVTLVYSPRHTGLRIVCGEMFFGYRSFMTAALPDRVYTGLDEARRPPSFLPMEPEIDLTLIPTPLSFLLGESPGSWKEETRRTLRRLEAFWLLVEDRYRLLDAQEIEPLAHQASLVEHVIAQEDLRRALIADEVGLGKTIEAGLIIKRLQEANPNVKLRVLYLTEARLVENVCEEFRRLGLDPRPWAAGNERAYLSKERSDELVVGSMHRAVFPTHFERVAQSGPWDVLIIDEAHHLTDYSPDGSSPEQRIKLVRRLLKERLVASSGRLLLLSGTPHQGHEARFKNLLRLLSESEDESQARGRVIYRIKDDIRDWDGRPLFPIRQINKPTSIRVGKKYRSWLEDVRELFSGADSRAGGWRKAQALQWCASSPEAGLAYLVRMALRMGLGSDEHQALYQALEVLRPYREGPPDEPVATLEARLKDPSVLTEEEAEAQEEEAPPVPVDKLIRVLLGGAVLVREDELGTKLARILAWLEEFPEEKLVIFAQPVETVYTLRRRLEAKLGEGSVAFIVGGQSAEARKKEIQRFWDEKGARVLVSSRSGGEGINLQISRRLIHFDVPWNPMELEQRVGRVHRFGSVSTVVVDTLVLEDSREEHVLDRCRARLGQIANHLAGAGSLEFDSLFSRTMSLVPVQELMALMAAQGFGPLDARSDARLSDLVRAGYDRWKRADQEFRQRSSALRAMHRGAVGEEDLEAFLTGAMGAQREPGWSRKVLELPPGETEPRLCHEEATIYRLPDGAPGYVGPGGGVGLSGPEGAQRPRRLGLNHPLIAEQLRLQMGGADPKGQGESALVRGAGFIKISSEGWRDLLEEHRLPTAMREGGLFFAYCMRRLNLSATPPRETGADLYGFLCGADGGAEQRLSSEQTAALIRLLRRGKPSQPPKPLPLDREKLLAAEAARIAALRQVAPGEPVAAVMPLAALWLDPSLALEEEPAGPGGFGASSLVKVAVKPEPRPPLVPSGKKLYALSVRQPYAEEILQGTKTEEYRSWRTRHTGLLLIHAASSREDLEADDKYPYAFKALIGVVELTGCSGHEGEYAWQLKNPRRFAKPIRYSGAQGLFPVPEELVREVLESAQPLKRK